MGVESNHYQLHFLGEGSYAAINQTGGAAICNAGLIDLGGLTLVFDTFLTPQAARDLQADCERLTGRGPDFVINSHYHNDHIWGNQVFSGHANIVSSKATRQLIMTEGMEEYRWYKENTAKKLTSVREKLLVSSDEQERESLSLWAGYYQGLSDAFPTLSVSLPNITFENQMRFYGSRDEACLMTYEGCHTADDAVLYLPNQRILFFSDMLFVGCHPYLGECDPIKLKNALLDLAKLDARILVPGHGPVGSPDDLQKMLRYIDHCVDMARRDEYGEEDGEIDRQMPPEFKDWIISDFYRVNIVATRKYLLDAN